MTEDSKAYWAWLQLSLGEGSFKPKRILSYFPDIPSFYDAGPTQWRSMGLFTPKELKQLSKNTLEDGKILIASSEAKGIQIITPACKAYPQRLYQIDNPPCMLYVKGSLPNLDEQPALAVVGTRNATTTGKQITYDLSMQLAQAGMVIISGGAKGIDTAAHQGALQGNGISVCVLGCGIEYPYLMENESMRQSIAEHGAIISEFPVTKPAFKHHFPIRNRIISGLSVGVLVVEAAERSGSLITARTALEQNRDVFAVPCGIYNPVSEGVNNLIKAGAKPVTKAQDILEEYTNTYLLQLEQFKTESQVQKKEEQMLFQEPRPVKVFDEKETTERHRELKEQLSQDGALLLSKLSNEPVHIEQLEALTGLSAQRILIAVTELCDAISSHSGRRYSLPGQV